MLEQIQKNDDYRCQVQARRSFTVTGMLGHLLTKLFVNILAQELLLIVDTDYPCQTCLAFCSSRFGLEDFLHGVNKDKVFQRC